MVDGDEVCAWFAGEEGRVHGEYAGSVRAEETEG